MLLDAMAPVGTGSHLTLPCGLPDDCGRIHSDAVLSALRGREEELLFSGGKTTAPEIVTELITRCVGRIGPFAPLTPAMARSLTITDRQFLLLKLREMTFGPEVQAVTRCAAPECGKKMDLEFSLTGLPRKGGSGNGPLFSVDLPGDDNGPAKRVVFRLPNGGDQESFWRYSEQGEDEVTASLFDRCVVSVDPCEAAAQPSSGPWGLTERDYAAIGKAIGEVGPAIETVLQLECPECGAAFTRFFDIQDFVLSELRTSRDELYREVHYLAWHYHWSEAEIMEMPRNRRRSYLRICGEEIVKMNGADGGDSFELG